MNAETWSLPERERDFAPRRKRGSRGEIKTATQVGKSVGRAENESGSLRETVRV